MWISTTWSRSGRAYPSQNRRDRNSMTQLLQKFKTVTFTDRLSCILFNIIRTTIYVCACVQLISKLDIIFMLPCLHQSIPKNCYMEGVLSVTSPHMHAYSGQLLLSPAALLIILYIQVAAMVDRSRLAHTTCNLHHRKRAPHIALPHLYSVPLAQLQ